MEIESQPGSNAARSELETVHRLHKRMKQSSIPLSTGHATTDTNTKQPPSDLKMIIDLYANASTAKKMTPVKQPGQKQ